MNAARQCWAALAAAGLALLAACSPELNWREVHLEGLTALLPCKPDAALRQVPLGGQDVTMNMLGCEANGGLFAISHVRLNGRQAADAARAQWRQQALASLQARSVQELSFRLTPPGGGQGASRLPEQARAEPSTESVAAQGVRPNGSPIEARLLWLAQGEDLYHVALYADQVSDETVEMLFSGLALQ